MRQGRAPIQSNWYPHKEKTLERICRQAQRVDSVEAHRESHTKTKDWNDVSTSQGMPKTADRSPTTRDKKRRTPHGVLEGTRSWQHIDFGLLASQAIRQQRSVVLSHPVAVTLSQHPKEADTDILHLPPGVTMTDLATFLCRFVFSISCHLVVSPEFWFRTTLSTLWLKATLSLASISLSYAFSLHL